MMSPEAGQTVAGPAPQGVGITHINPAGPAKVPAHLLANPAIQQAAMGNVSNK